MRIEILILRVFSSIVKNVDYGISQYRGINSNVNNTLHAEIAVLNKCRFRGKVSLVVLRLNSSGNLDSSKPCYHCLKSISQHRNIRVKNVYYSNSDGTITKTSLSKLLFEEDYHITSYHR